MEPLAQVTRAAFVSLAETVLDPSAHVDLSGLEREAEAARQEFLHVRDSFGEKYSPDEILRFGSFFHSMQEIAQKLTALVPALHPKSGEED